MWRVAARLGFLPLLAALSVAGTRAFDGAGVGARFLALDRQRLTSNAPAQPGVERLVGLGVPAQPSSALALAHAFDRGAKPKAAPQTLAFIADEDESSLLVFELPGQAVPSPRYRRPPPEPHVEHRASIAIPGRPTQVLVTRDGVIAVALRDRAEIAFLAATQNDAFEVIGTAPACREPIGMALSPDDSRIAVACAWGGEVAEISVRDRNRLARVKVGREPRAIAYDGGAPGKAYVVHGVGGAVTTVDFATRYASSAEIVPDPTPIMARFTGESDTIGLFFGLGENADADARLNALGAPPVTTLRASPALGQGFTFAVVRSGTENAPAELAIPMLAANTDAKTARVVRTVGYSSGGGRFTEPAPATEAELDLVNPEAPSARSTRLGGVDASCRLPRASTFDRKLGVYFVACWDRSHVAVFDVLRTRPQVRTSFQVGAGANGVAWRPDESDLVVWSSFDRVLAIHRPFDTNDAPVVRGTDTHVRRPTPFEVGRKLFHATDHPGISNDGRACATCHPDGRDDGLVWSSPSGPRQTPMLAGRLAASAPFGWTGASKTVRSHLGETLQRLGGSGLRDSEVYALLSYLERIPGPPAEPERELAAKGEAIFRSSETGCASCHDPRSGFTDGQRHDVSSATPADSVASLDTPSLRFVGRTAPYFHDGRYATLRELLTSVDGTMGNTGHLHDAELDALTAYLESL